MGKLKLAVICGPTASGKTALAVDVARALGGEIVSADSMQVYRGMDIGTAKPGREERGGIPHHLIDCADPDESFGAAVYRDMARACIEDIAGRGKLPILCGGTGLYISAVVYPLDFSNAVPDSKYRQEMQEYAGEHGNEALYALLTDSDPVAAKAIHPNNVRRVIRALERIRSVEREEPRENALFSGVPLYDAAWVGLSTNRETLYKRIENRVGAMMRQGLLNEVRQISGKYGAGSTALQALGYKELVRHLNGGATLEEAMQQIKTGTRNYAKRQLTWFKRERSIRWFDTGDVNSGELLAAVTGYIRETLHIG